jgi:serine/threonine protein kinase
MQEMRTMVGKTIAHYKILEKLGEGGMGIVYKAEDTKLKRTVALKFLSTQALGTEEEKARFVREAQAAASLNHPNICTIYEIQEVDDQLFIAMEYIDGETLHDRIKQGPLKIKEALKLATMASEGLQAAHEKDIIHRDIKSSNIMLTKKGVAKIMDFGLAKVSAVSVLTQAGSTLGTIAYMSPEQAKGEPVDQRSDIFSLGIVLYEMVAGQVPFRGEYEQAMMYSILNVDPEPLTAVRTGVPIALDSIVAKLLAKDPDDRYQHVDELPVDLKAVDVKRGSSSSMVSTLSSSQVAQQSVSRRRVIPLSIAVLVMVVVAIVASIATWVIKREPQGIVKRLTVTLPPEQQLPLAPIALSPNGKYLVYGANEGGESRLYLRSLENYDTIPLLGTEGGYGPFFSPDERWVGFHTDSEIKKVSLAGGQAQTITRRLDRYTTGIWGPDDTIIIGRYKSGLYQVSIAGGTPEALAVPDEESQEIWECPVALNGTRTIFLNIHTPQEDGGIQHSIAALDLDTGSRKILIENGSRPQYARSGHLLFVQDGQVMAVGLDAQHVEVIGVPVPIAENFPIFRNNSRVSVFSTFSIADDGTLVYIPMNEESQNRRLVIVDREGNSTPMTAEPNDYNAPSISPDGNRIVVQIGNIGDEHLWIYDIKMHTLIQLTFENDNDFHAEWTPDGKWVVFGKSTGLDRFYLSRKLADGSGQTDSLYTSKQLMVNPTFSPDGTILAFSEGDTTDEYGIKLLNMEDGTVSTFFDSPADDFLADFSPDGRWIAYYSDESGDMEIYVKPYPGSGGKRRISTGGGTRPVWSPDGKELFYRKDNLLMVVAIETEPNFSRGEPRPLFEASVVSGFDVFPDGRRFIMIQREDPPGTNEIHIVLNFDEELKRKVPTGN